MFINRVLENIDECTSEAKEFGAKLKETPIGERNIFKIAQSEDCYKAMIGILNETKKDLKIATEDRELKALRRLLREVWRKYEDKLKVNNYYLWENKEKKGFHENGVDINILQDIVNDWDPIERIGWRVAYHSIFHEFFHNIDYAAETISCTYKDNIFGKTIEIEIKELLSEENDKNKKADEKRLRILTYNVVKREKAALYDLIGGVLYRGKYGCNPSNSEYYNKGKNGKGEKCKNRFLCDKLSKDDPQTAHCDFRKNCEPNECLYGSGNIPVEYRCYYGNHTGCYRKYEKYNDSVQTCFNCDTYKKKKCYPTISICGYKCNKIDECKYNYKNECNLEDNNWCNNIFGHSRDYWGDKPEKDSTSTSEFLVDLASEAFAHFAAEAIVNPEAYKKIREYLPNSENVFREIIRKILWEKLAKFHCLWA